MVKQAQKNTLHGRISQTMTRQILHTQVKQDYRTGSQ